MDTEKIGKGIGFLRRRYGFTQRHLAELLNISDKAVSKWERGLSVPDGSLLSQLAQIFDTDIESLLEGNLANFQQEWQGELVLSYPANIHADSLLYDKQVICYQLSYFMLAGIVRIRVCGEEEELSRIKRLFGQGERFGLELVYGVPDERRTSCRTMRVSGLPFLYGKDLTKTMRRILYGSAEQVRLTDDEKRGLGITFVRRPADMWQDVPLERGTIAFPIKDHEALLAASDVAAAVFRMMGERIADLHEIAIARNLIG